LKYQTLRNERDRLRDLTEKEYQEIKSEDMPKKKIWHLLQINSALKILYFFVREKEWLNTEKYKLTTNYDEHGNKIIRDSAGDKIDETKQEVSITEEKDI